MEKLKAPALLSPPLLVLPQHQPDAGIQQQQMNHPQGIPRQHSQPFGGFGGAATFGSCATATGMLPRTVLVPETRNEVSARFQNQQQQMHQQKQCLLPQHQPDAGIQQQQMNHPQGIARQHFQAAAFGPAAPSAGVPAAPGAKRPPPLAYNVQQPLQHQYHRQVPRNTQIQQQQMHPREQCFPPQHQPDAGIQQQQMNHPQGIARQHFQPAFGPASSPPPGAMAAFGPASHAMAAFGPASPPPPGAPVSDIATTTVQPTAAEKMLMKMRLADKCVTVKNDSKEEVQLRWRHDPKKFETMQSKWNVGAKAGATNGLNVGIDRNKERLGDTPPQHESLAPGSSTKLLVTHGTLYVMIMDTGNRVVKEKQYQEGVTLTIVETGNRLVKRLTVNEF